MNEPQNKNYQQVRDYVYNMAREIIEDMGGEPDKLTTISHLKVSAGVDSMGLIELLARVEKQFRVSIPEHEFPKFSTVQNIAEVVCKYQKEQAR